MAIQGSINPNWDHLDELFSAIVLEFANEQSKLAVWLIDSLDLSSIPAQSIGAESPFSESSSVLAGSGWLIELNPETIGKVIENLATNDHLNYEILHFEFEVNHMIQFASYDHSGYVKFGDGISLDVLENLKAQQVIDGYDLFNGVLLSLRCKLYQ